MGLVEFRKRVAGNAEPNGRGGERRCFGGAKRAMPGEERRQRASCCHVTDHGERRLASCGSCYRHANVPVQMGTTYRHAIVVRPYKSREQPASSPNRLRSDKDDASWSRCAPSSRIRSFWGEHESSPVGGRGIAPGYCSSQAWACAPTPHDSQSGLLCCETRAPIWLRRDRLWK